MDKMHIKDTITGEVHKISPALNTISVTSRDGTRVKLHPVTIKVMVCKGAEFEAQTVLGPRKMRRI